jgi:hypothetical protein
MKPAPKKNRALASTLNVLGLVLIIGGLILWMPAGWVVALPTLITGLVLRTLGEVLDRLPAPTKGLP